MDIDRCNSIFELFAAFNFTYAVLSEATQNENLESYVDIIDNRLLRPLSTFFNKGNKMLEDMELKEKSLTELNVFAMDEDKSKLGIIQGKLEHQKKLCVIWVDQVSNKRKKVKVQINSIFPYLSYCMALFCISVLGVAISEFDFKHFTLFLLLLNSSICIGVIYWKKSKNDYFSLTFTYGLGFLLIFSSHIYLSTGEPVSNINILKSLNFINSFKNGIILTSLILPLSHFIIYFFFIGTKFTRMKGQRELELDNYILAYSGIKLEIDNMEEKLSPNSNKKFLTQG